MYLYSLIGGLAECSQLLVSSRYLIESLTIEVTPFIININISLVLIVIKSASPTACMAVPILGSIQTAAIQASNPARADRC